MDRFFQIEDAILKLHSNLRKYSDYATATKQIKIDTLINLNKELKEIVTKNKFDTELQNSLIARYRQLKEFINEGIERLNGNILDDSILENLFIQEEFGQQVINMAQKIDLSIALRLVDKFNGEADRLLGFFETIDLLKDYSDGVPDAELIKFIKTRLTGPAHGAITTATTLAEVKKLLKDKFSIKFSPQAIEAEMASMKQQKKTISEYGHEMNELAAKLSAAHVSQGTFSDESAASAIVQPVAVKSFTNGLKDHRTQFFLKARNPNTLVKAISDALEVQNTEEESAMWFHASPSRQKPQNPYRGRGFQTRGFSSFRRGNRSRGYGHNRGRGRNQYNHYDQHQNNYNHQAQYNNQPNNNQHQYQPRGGHNNRGRQGHANVAIPVPQPRPEPPEDDVANVIDLFRE